MLINFVYFWAALKDIDITPAGVTTALTDFLVYGQVIHFAIDITTPADTLLTVAYTDTVTGAARWFTIKWDSTVAGASAIETWTSGPVTGTVAFVAATYDSTRTAYLADPTQPNLDAFVATMPAKITTSNAATAFPDLTTEQIEDIMQSSSWIKAFAEIGRASCRERV